MKVVLLLGFVALAAVYIQPSEACEECKSCWNYKHCEITEFPWIVRRWFAVSITRVTLNNFWGKGKSCGMFNKCSKKVCGCVGLDVGRIEGRILQGQWFSLNRKTHVQFMRRYWAVVHENNAEMTFFLAAQATWKVPAIVVKRVFCDECGKVKNVKTYVVPDAEVKVKMVSVEVRAIILVMKIKFRILLLCNGLKGIVSNKPFVLVLTTMPFPSKGETWKEVNNALYHFNIDPHKMKFLRHEFCIYPPFDWCNSWVAPKNNDCNICKMP
nr:PREDICTED: uncharacterized protein LOC109031181 [Bemisia tabaci]XP_018898092.1 PREDICTED: uncharacterized protein LOC109031181 [Bemisia tabaci]XP_018898093.1 PREDICTED: uncharacterized protein LOC109031181 [Bemisia tabaci]